MGWAQINVRQILALELEGFEETFLIRYLYFEYLQPGQCIQTLKGNGIRGSYPNDSIIDITINSLDRLRHYLRFKLTLSKLSIVQNMVMKVGA